MIDRLTELEDKIGNQTLKINHQTLKINQFEAENRNQTLKINQLEAELEMLQDRNDSYGNFNFLLSLFTQG